MSAHAPDDKLLDLLYGELPPDEAEELRAHIDADPELRADFEQLRSDRDLAAQHTSAPAEVPAALTENILASARTHTPSSTRSARDVNQSIWRRTWQNQGLRKSLIAAALIVGVAGILRSLQLDTLGPAHDPMAEHGMAAPASLQAPQAEAAAEEAEAFAEEKLEESAAQRDSETPSTDGPSLEATERERSEAPPTPQAVDELADRAASITTTDQRPAEEAEPLAEPEPRARQRERSASPQPRPATRAERRARSSVAEIGGAPTGDAPAPARSPAPSTRYGASGGAALDSSNTAGRGGLGQRSPEPSPAPRESFAYDEMSEGAEVQQERAAPAPDQDRALAPAAPTQKRAPARAEAEASAAPTLRDDVAIGTGSASPEEDNVSAEEEVAAPPTTPLQRARQARTQNNPEATLREATDALTNETNPRRRAEAYTLIAWAQDQLGNADAARTARQQATDALSTIESD